MALLQVQMRHYIAFKKTNPIYFSILSRPPSRLIIAIIVVRQAAQIRAIGADDVNLTAVVISVFVKIGGESHPFAVWGKTGSLAVATSGCELT